MRHDGKVAVKIGSELEFLQPPAGKDIDAQMVVDLRRMLRNAGYEGLHNPRGRTRQVARNPCANG